MLEENLKQIINKTKTTIMKKVIIKLKDDNIYWKQRTRGTTDDINEAHHFDEDEAEAINALYTNNLELIDVPKKLTGYTLKSAVQGEFEGILTSLNSLLEYKNKKYGNVALNPLNIFSEYGGIGQRLDDKLARIKNCDELRKNDVCDLMGYLVLLCKEHGFESFEEFKD